MLRAATLWHYDRDSSRSIQWCRRVLEIEPNNGEAHRLWALALVQDAEYSRSISEFQAAAAASPKDDSILLEMGLAYKRAGDRRNARETLDAACKMNPRNSRACNEARLTPIN
jgi:Flp pilus assembly protein TadD